MLQISQFVSLSRKQIKFLTCIQHFIIKVLNNLSYNELNQQHLQYSKMKINYENAFLRLVELFLDKADMEVGH